MFLWNSENIIHKHSRIEKKNIKLLYDEKDAIYIFLLNVKKQGFAIQSLFVSMKYYLWKLVCRQDVPYAQKQKLLIIGGMLPMPGCADPLSL